MWYNYYNRTLFSQKKKKSEWIANTCYNMGEPQKCYGK